MEQPQRNQITDSTRYDDSNNVEVVEGLDEASGSWGDYPIDDLLIRQDNRTIYDVIRRIEMSNYIMDPDFQRDFIWREDKQSKLIESVIMRISLPVFYMAEDNGGTNGSSRRLTTTNTILAISKG